MGVPLALYLASRLLQVGFVAAMAPDDGRTLVDRLTVWDGGWYIRIADEGYEPGYSYDHTGALTGNGLAFFPLYPLLLRVVAAVPGVSSAGAALGVSWLAGAIAAVLLSLLGERLYDRRTGYALAVLFAAQPMSVVLTMGYTEALFCALVVASLLALHQGAWLLAGVAGMFAALTRPTGLALAGALLVTALWWLWRDRSDYPSWRVTAGVALAVLAAPGYLLWVGLRVGELDAWFRIQQAGWGTEWDFGMSTLRFLRDTFAAGEGWVQVSTAVIIVLAALGVLVAWCERVWLPLSLYGLFAFAMAVGSSGYYHSRPRMLVPVLVLLVPLAVAAARCRPRTAVAVLGVATLLGCWYGAYMITVWPYTI